MIPRTLDFQKEILQCVSMCFKKEIINKYVKKHIRGFDKAMQNKTFKLSQSKGKDEGNLKST